MENLEIIMNKSLLLLFVFVFSAFAMQENKVAPNIKTTNAYLDERLDLYTIEAKNNQTSCGSITFKYNPENKNIGHIYNLDVSPDYRKNGIGYQLFRQAILELKKQGYQKITWLGWSLNEEPIPSSTLIKIYKSMWQKLSLEIKCDLETTPDEYDPEETFFTLTLKT